MPWTTIAAGTPITSAWANANVRDQAVSTFATAAARASAIPSPTVGLVSYIVATQSLEIYVSAATGWRGPWNLPWGTLYSVGSGGTAGIALGTGGAETVAASASLAIPANRKIMVSGHLTISGAASFFAEVRIRRGGTGGGEMARSRAIAPSLLGSSYVTCTIAPQVDTGYTPGAGVLFSLTGQGGDLVNPSSFTVSDGGPNGNPV